MRGGKGHGPIGAEYATHDKNDSLYVDATHRICPKCQRTLTLWNFRNGTTYRDGEKIRVLCMNCCSDRKDEHLTEALTTIASAVKKASGRRALVGHSTQECAEHVFKRIGGFEKTWDLYGSAIEAGLTSGKVSTQLAAAAQLLDLQTSGERLQGEVADESNVTTDEKKMILAPYAKEMLLEDSELRRQLLLDPEVRAALLAEVGQAFLQHEGAKPCQE